MTAIFKLISLFTPRERRKLIPLTVAVFVMSLLEIAGIGSLAPFMAVVADPGVIEDQALLAAVYELGGFQSARSFLIALGIGVLVMVMVASGFKMLTLYGLYRFVGNRRYTLSHRLFRQYIYQPYSYYLNHNTSELSKNLLTEVDLVVNGVLRPAADMFAKGTLVIAIMVFLFVINPVVALAATLVFGILYAGIYGFVRPRIMRYGVELRESNRDRFKAAGEAFGAIKDVKILGKEPRFSRNYGEGARRFATTQAANQILSNLPKEAMQAIAIGFAVALVVAMLNFQGTLVQVLPLIGIYGFAVQRMIPNLQAVFQAVAQMRYYGHTVDGLYRDMTEMPPAPSFEEERAREQHQEVHPFNREVQVRELSFSYPASAEPVLNGINLTIKKNTTVGFVGTTGCGKTTLVDVVMGLLEPDSGEILVDGRPVGSDSGVSTSAWQRNFGYVPQQIYLSDDSVQANIAFGIPQDKLDHDRVEKAARVANLHEFVLNGLPQGYDTVVGERGIRLSGGQRQRIGIARALYHDPEILVMDEATSALDSVTEEAVMDAIHALMHSKTIILIAHRITTVQECDRIYMLERGRVVAEGGYEELIRENPRFRAMAKVAG